MWRNVVLLLGICWKEAFGAYCGTSTIPYSFEVLPNGNPILGCGRPCCFGWNYERTNWATDDSQFMINNVYDGFLREDPIPRDTAPPPEYPQFCAGSARCNANQWASGFTRLQDGRFFMICCTFFPLNRAENLGMARVHPGEIFSGGDVTDGGFDYVRNIIPVIYSNGTISRYEIEVGRLPCRCNAGCNKMEDGFEISVVELARKIVESLKKVEIPAVQSEEEAQQVQMVQQPVQQVYYTPYYYTPSYGGWGGGWGGISACFASDSIVVLNDGRKIQMDELSLQDAPLSPNNTMDTVVYTVMKSWIHRLPEKMMKFLMIQTESGKELKITEKHFLFKSDCFSRKTSKINADELILGDCLLETDNFSTLQPKKVVNIRKIEQKGIYAPLTDTGMIIINGIAVSCHSEMENDAILSTFVKSLTSCEEDQCEINNFGKSLLLDMAKLVLSDLPL